MFGFGIGELLIILVIVMLIFGVGKLPEIGSGLGRAIGNFKKASRDQAAIDITPRKDQEKQAQQEKKA